jgi:ABC-type multidrug transport system fused ATPase/permease subunit
MLEKGQVVEKGKHNELMEKQGVYYQIYESQLMDQEENHTEEQ